MMSYKSDNDNFLFFGNYWDAAKKFSDNIEVQKEFIWSICEYGTTGKISTDNPGIRGYIEGISYSIQKSKNNYNKKIYSGKAGPGRPKKINRKLVKEMFDDGLTPEEISEALNCSTKQIKNIQEELFPKENYNLPRVEHLTKEDLKEITLFPY